MNVRFVNSSCSTSSASEGTQMARDQFESVLQGVIYKQDYDTADADGTGNRNRQRYPESILEYNIVDIDSSCIAPPHRPEENDNSGVCVVKLFERCVDLSQFSSKIPLYEMCKLWMRDDGCSCTRSGSETKNQDQYTSGSEFREAGSNRSQLPKPDAAIRIQRYPPSNLMNGGESKQSRKRKIDLTLCADGSGGVIYHNRNMDGTFRDMRIQWNKCRKKWQRNNAINERRYRQSCCYLTNMFSDSNGGGAGTVGGAGSMLY